MRAEEGETRDPSVQGGRGRVVRRRRPGGPTDGVRGRVRKVRRVRMDGMSSSLGGLGRCPRETLIGFWRSISGRGEDGKDR